MLSRVKRTQDNGKGTSNKLALDPWWQLFFQLELYIRRQEADGFCTVRYNQLSLTLNCIGKFTQYCDYWPDPFIRYDYLSFLSIFQQRNPNPFNYWIRKKRTSNIQTARGQIGTDTNIDSLSISTISCKSVVIPPFATFLLFIVNVASTVQKRRALRVGSFLLGSRQILGGCLSLMNI